MSQPDGYSTVTPYLFVEDASRYSRFLQEVFGGDELGRSLMPNGRIANCQVRIGDSVIMLSEASQLFPASSAAFYLYTNDVEAGMARAQGAGCEVVMEIADMPYGDRQGGVRDPFGSIWWISKRLVKEPYFPKSGL